MVDQASSTENNQQRPHGNIGKRAFYGCRKLQIVELPDHIRDIGEGAFLECEDLVKVRLPAGLKVISEKAFTGCNSLEGIEFPKKLESIEAYAFASCESLKEIKIPRSIKEIGDGAFRACTKLEKVQLPTKSIRIHTDSFSECPRLWDDQGFLVVGGMLFDCKCQGSFIRVPDGVTLLKRQALKLSDEVAKVYLPVSLRAMESAAITRIYRREINIPAGFLQQAKNQEATMILTLLKGPWEELVTTRDWAALRIFQSSSKLHKALPEDRLKPDEVVGHMSDLLLEKGKKAHFKRAADYCLEYVPQVSPVQIDRLYALCKEAGLGEEAERLVPYISGGSMSPKKASHPLEAFCLENFSAYQVTQFMEELDLDPEIFAKARYRDSQETASSFVVQCALFPYIKQWDQPMDDTRYGFKYTILKLRVEPDADRVAAGLDRADFLKVLDSQEKAVDSVGACLLLPFGRFAPGEWLEAMYDYRRVSSKYHGKEERRQHIAATSAVLLNESHEALLIAEKIDRLHEMADVWDMSFEAFYSTRFLDTGLDANGRKTYDLGGKVIEAVLGEDLKLRLVDAKTGKALRSIPKKDMIASRVQMAREDYKILKKRVNQVVKATLNPYKGSF